MIPLARGLFLIFAAHGHVNPTIGLVKGLIDKGDEITYISSNEFKDRIEFLGAKFKGYDETFNLNPDNTNPLCFMMNKVINMNKNINIIALKETQNYDYIVCDPMIFPSEKLKKKLNIKKTISTFTTFAICDEIVKQVIYSKNEKEHNEYLEYLSNLKNELSYLKQTYAIDIPDSMEKIYLGCKADLSLVFTSKDYQPYIDKFDDKQYKFIGPSITTRKDLQNFKIENPNNKKIIYISLGTVANQNLNFYKNCLEAFGNRDDLLNIMCIGNNINISQLGHIPKNFKVYNYVPQLEVLKQTDVFITHGGMNSVNEGLYYSIPLIVAPQYGDQILIGKRVEALNLGINLSTDISVQALSSALDNILKYSSYKKNAKKMSKSLKDSGGYKKSVEYIHSII